ncbi:MAG: hypothetical protein DCF22_15480 [Leptolyngbya sp.]|nr:MAG: hypothetical protein DCF22_15480 [Leptolyngbya sp.]
MLILFTHNKDFLILQRQLSSALEPVKYLLIEKQNCDLKHCQNLDALIAIAHSQIYRTFFCGNPLIGLSTAPNESADLIRIDRPIVSKKQNEILFNLKTLIFMGRFNRLGQPLEF